MNAFPDTSFLYSLYRRQTQSQKAIAFMHKLAGSLPVSGLLILEFRQSMRFQMRLYAQDKTKGFPKHQGAQMLRDLQSDLREGVLEILPVDWPGVHQLAENLSARHTENRGCRLVDILHVATALHLGAAEFLTFDANQKLLAESERMKVIV